MTLTVSSRPVYAPPDHGYYSHPDRRHATDAQHSAVTQQSRNNIITVVADHRPYWRSPPLRRRRVRWEADPQHCGADRGGNECAGLSARATLMFEVKFESKNELARCEALRTSQQVLRALVDDGPPRSRRMAGQLRHPEQGQEVFTGGLQSVLESIRMIYRNLSDTLAQINLSAERVSAVLFPAGVYRCPLAQAADGAVSVEELSATISEISSKAQENVKQPERYGVLAGHSNGWMRAPGTWNLTRLAP